MDYELIKLISKARYPNKEETFVTSAEIAEVITKAGYVKIEDQILVTARMQKAALLAFYKGIHDIRELEGNPETASAPSRMLDALYAAFAAWRDTKFLTSKDHAQRQ
jgi:hypothetical protein